MGSVKSDGSTEKHNTRSVGRLEEELAARFLEEQGCRILERNFQVRVGEVDIIYMDGETVCFGEVKYRREDDRGEPEEAVNRRKQFKISRVSDHYRARMELSEDMSYRFDVLSINGVHEVKWIRNAFEYLPVGRGR